MFSQACHGSREVNRFADKVNQKRCDLISCAACPASLAIQLNFNVCCANITPRETGSVIVNEHQRMIETAQAGARILLVDDDPVMLELAGAKLREAGHDVSVAFDGLAALDSLGASQFDLVISDLDMPRLDGFGLTRTIRKNPELQAIPVIVVTASERIDAVERAFAAGATSFLAKPINWTLYTQAVRFVLKAAADQIALREARDRAEAGARFKDGLLSVMSHELRTPLNAIIGFGQILADQAARDHDDAHREYAEYIVDGGRRLLSAISDLLLASDARSGPLAINESEWPAADLIEQAVEPLRATAASAGAELKISARMEAGDELLVDQILIVRALTKLIENAVKFSPRGVKIIIGAGPVKSGGMAFIVKDDGPGVETERVSRLAMPFGQIDMSLRRSKEGIGLGLPIVQAIAQAHGGRLRLDSAPGAGFQAAIALPASRVVKRGGVRAA
jgi:signal transduction histidine kinase